MTVKRRVRLGLLATAVIALHTVEIVHAGGPQVALIVGPQAPPLEQLAARELAGQLKQLYDAEVTIEDGLNPGEAAVIVLGSPATNPALKPLAGDWPALTVQGHTLRSVTLSGRRALVIGGGSPVATLWGAYELGHHFGIRYMLYGDEFPAKPVPFSIDNFSETLEPKLKLRTWRTVNDFPIGPESWGLAEQERFIRQLAKLKYNRILLSFYPWQPFVHFEFDGIAKRSAPLWFGYQYRVDGDTAGRGVFKGAKSFDNPDFLGKTTYTDRIEAGTKLARGIIRTAKDLGMSAAIVMSPLEFPREFAPALPQAESVHQLEVLTVGPGPSQRPGDQRLHALAKAQIRGYLDTYPEIDALYLTLPEFPGWSTHYEAAWRRLAERTGLHDQLTLDRLLAAARDRKTTASGERGVAALKGNITALDFLHTLLADPEVLALTEQKSVQPVMVDVDPAFFPVLDKVVPAGSATLNFVDYTARRTLANRELLAQLPAAKLESSLILTLADDNVGVLPQSSHTALHELVGELKKQGWAGFSTRYWMPGDLDLIAYYLSRSSFGSGLTPEDALTELLAPVSGAGVSERVQLAFDQLERATELIEANDLGFTFPVPGVVLKHYHTGDAVPSWWAEVRDLYLGAMNEMYRANQRAQTGGRAYTLYLARRCDFAFNYMSAIEAVKKAGIAKRAGDAGAHAKELQSAVDALHDALNALAAVARSNSDRGAIAVLNEYGYRPLKKELDALPAE